MMAFRIGNRVTEKDIRDWLDVQGIEGRSARISHLELTAIARPGWIQVFSFKLRSKPSTQIRDSASNDEMEWSDRWGVVLDDERIRNSARRTQIWVFDNEMDYEAKLDSVSEGMLRCRTGQNGELVWVVLFFAVLIAIAAAGASFFG